VKILHMSLPRRPVLGGADLHLKQLSDGLASTSQTNLDVQRNADLWTSGGRRLGWSPDSRTLGTETAVSC
jgi:hypothetical protein